MSDDVIRTEQLSVYYGQRRGVEGVDLHVEQGEVFGFLGPNGAGKTTILRVLLDIIRPNRGRATIFGLDCQKDGVQIRQRIGYVPGELALPPHQKGRDYLNMLDAVRQRSSDPDYRRKLCSRLDLDLSRPIRQYSRGNKQKLALVAAFMHKPDLLILDEPTGGLDPLIQQAVLDTVREARSESRTTFFSSHILPEVQAVADRVGIIRNGRLIAIERISELLHRRIVRLHVHLQKPLPISSFEALEGIKLLHHTEQEMRIEISKNLPQLMQILAEKEIRDIQTENISLDELFLAYYGRINNNADNEDEHKEVLR